MKSAIMGIMKIGYGKVTRPTGNLQVSLSAGAFSVSGLLIPTTQHERTTTVNLYIQPSFYGDLMVMDGDKFLGTLVRNGGPDKLYDSNDKLTDCIGGKLKDVDENDALNIIKAALAS